MACAYSSLVTRFVFAELGGAESLDSAVQTVLFTSQIIVIVAATGLFS